MSGITRCWRILEDYSLNVDNDEVVNANNDITIFVNCKIYDEKDNTIGIIGVGLRVDLSSDYSQGNIRMILM